MQTSIVNNWMRSLCVRACVFDWVYVWGIKHRVGINSNVIKVWQSITLFTWCNLPLPGHVTQDSICYSCHTGDHFECVYGRECVSVCVCVCADTMIIQPLIRDLSDGLKLSALSCGKKRTAKQLIICSSHPQILQTIPRCQENIVQVWHVHARARVRDEGKPAV